MTCGIYILRFEGTSKVYIGQSINIENRFNLGHLANLRLGIASKKLQDAFSIFGNPTLEVLLECDTSTLDTNENEAIEIFNSVDNGFNTCRTAGSFPILYGEEHGSAKYTNEQYEAVLNLLIETPIKNQSIISEITGVSEASISQISKCVKHKWLKEKYPEKYKILESLKGARVRGQNHGMAKYSNSAIEEVFKLLLEVTNSFKRIQGITGVSEASISKISKCVQHRWLKEKYPEKYKVLEYLNGTRNCAKSRGLDIPLIKSPVGEVYLITNITQFSKEHSLDRNYISEILKGKKITYKGWTLA